MKIYDISQEVFGGEVYPGDPKAVRREICSMAKGDLYNLTAFDMCAHNGTHIDAPAHFIDGGKTVDEMDLGAVLGMAFVVQCNGIVDEKVAAAILERAFGENPEAGKRILIKGDGEVNEAGAQAFAKAGVLLLGSETQSVGPKASPMAVHRIFLEKEVVLLEGIRLGEVSEGVYFLSAAPLNLGGAEGSPCRAVLLDFDK